MGKLLRIVGCVPSNDGNFENSKLGKYWVSIPSFRQNWVILGKYTQFSQKLGK